MSGIPMFTFGKYRNETFATVADKDPGYVVWAYETVAGHAGIPHKLYRQAQLDHAEREDDDDPRDWDGDDFDYWGDK